jgi:hypothetical protein
MLMPMPIADRKRFFVAHRMPIHINFDLVKKC